MMVDGRAAEASTIRNGSTLSLFPPFAGCRVWVWGFGLRAHP